MIQIVKPDSNDLPKIDVILSFWTDEEEADKYTEKIKNEISGNTEYNMHFWVAKEGQEVLGVAGLADPIPAVIPFAKTENPGEIKILYVDNERRGKGTGKELINFLENEAAKKYSELLVRSAERYRDTAYGFYKKMGYLEVGTIANQKGFPMQVFEKML